MSHLTGREQQLNSILDSINKIIKREDANHVIFLIGEAGVGKSTLIENLRNTLNERGRYFDEDRPFAAYAACTTPITGHDNGGSEALKPWADIMQKLINSEEVNTAEKKDFDFKKFMVDSAPSWMKMVPVIGTTLEAAVDIGAKAYGQKRRTDEKIAGSQEQIFQQYINFLSRISDEKPLVLIIDDFHWADDSSTNLLFTAARQLANKRVCFIITYRDDDVKMAREGKGHPIFHISNELKRYNLCDTIELERFTKEQTREILTGIYKGKGISQDKKFLNWLTNVSEGNGLYITNFLAKLEEEGYIESKTGEVLKDYTEVNAPEGNLALIRSRIKNIPEDEQEVPRYASVEGSIFTMEVLKEILEEKPLKLLQKLRILEEKSGLIESLGKQLIHTKETTAYKFSHVQVHKAMYESLEDEERELLHQAIFDVLEKEWETAKEEDINVVNIAVKIAGHAEALQNYLFAAETLLEAAKETWTTYAAEEALRFIEDVFKNIDKAEINSKDTDEKKSRKLLSIRIEAMILQIDIFELKGKWKEAISVYETALVFAEKLNSKKYIALLSAAIGVVYRMLGDYKNSMNTFEKALSINEELDDKANVAYVCGCIGVAYFEKGNYPQAMEYYERKLAICEEINDEKGKAHMMGAMGNVYFSKGDYSKALEYHNKKLAICEELNDARNISFTLGHIGNVYYNLADYNKALECYERKLAISKEIGDVGNLVTVLGNLGNVYYARGEYSKALEYHQKKIDLSEELSEPYSIGIALGNMGVVYVVLGDYNKAIECYEKKRIIGEKLENKNFLLNVYGGLGSCYFELGNFAKALEYFNKELPIDIELDDKLNIASCTGNKAAVLFEQGKYKEAYENFNTALKIHKEIGFILGVQVWLYFIGKIYLEEYLSNQNFPEYLKDSIEDESKWREIVLKKAEDSANESIGILKGQLDNSEEKFNVKILLLRIEHAKGNKDKAIIGLKKLLEEDLSSQHRADAYYWLWKLSDDGAEKNNYGKEAISLHEKLLAEIPNFRFKKHTEEIKAAS